MYIRAYLKDKTTVLLQISRLLDCKGNRSKGGKGTKDYMINGLGLTDKRCIELFGIDVDTLLSTALTLTKVDSFFELELKIPEVDFQAISEMVFIGAEPQKIIPLNDNLLKLIV